MKQKDDFFAKVHREPVLRQLESGGYRFCFFPRRQFLAEAVCILLISGLLFGYALQETIGWIGYVALVPIAAGYSGMAVVMARLDRAKHVVLDGSKLLTGVAADELPKTIKGVFVLSLSGTEDHENTENGSERLYLVLEQDGGSEAIYPFIFVQVGLERLAKEIAKISGQPYRWVWGLHKLPKELHDQI